MSVNSENSMCCMAWVPTSILTWVQTLLEKVKTLMNHRVLIKLIPIFKEFKQWILKTACSCENYAIINIFHHNSGKCPDFVDTKVWYGSVVIQQTLYSSEFSRFEKISKLQLCSHNSGQFPELPQRSMNLVIQDNVPDYEEKYGTTSSCSSNILFTQFNVSLNLVDSPVLENSILFHSN